MMGGAFSVVADVQMRQLVTVEARNPQPEVAELGIGELAPTQRVEPGAEPVGGDPINGIGAAIIKSSAEK